MLRFLSQFSSVIRFQALVGLSAVPLLVSTVAAAQQVDDFGAYRTKNEAPRNESSRDFALELRFGPYLPRVDSEFSGGEHPFRDYYGTKDRFMVGTEFDWLPLSVRNVLRFGVGAGLSYTAMGAKAKQADGGGDASGQDTRFRVLPHWLVGVLRLDVLHRNTPVPIVFVGKLGLGNALWWVKDDPSHSRAEDGTKGKGQSYGLYYGLGAALDLGVLDPYRARRLDGEVGINSIYLIGELYGMELESFGASDAMHVGDRNWLLGLGFDF